MRHTYRGQCLSADKAHLWRLPNLESPVDVEMSPSKRGLIVYTLFHSHHRDDTVAHHDALAACWSRKSWLENTDASDFGVDAKFYVEESVRGQAEPVFAENYVSDADVLYFDGEPFEGDPLTRCGKKCAIFVDDRFADYDWVFQIDTDLFAMRGGYPLDIFKRFFEGCQKPAIGCLYVGEHEDGVPYPNINGKSWLRWVHDSEWDASAENRAHVDEWIRRVVDLGGGAVIKNYLTDYEMFPEPQGSLISFPAKHFHEYRQKDCEWLAEAGRQLQTDEAALCLWYLLGRPSFSVRDELDIPVIGSDINLDGDQLEAYRCFVRNWIPFLFHFSTTLFEVVWRDRIGAL